MGETIRLTMTQALVRYLCMQRTIVDGREEPLFPGVFAIFGHGNVTCLSEALEAVQDRLPTWRGQNEQSMALAAIGFAKAKRRRQIMVAATSIGPGALNMVTAAGTALANRLPVLLLAGDTFASRRPDPVLQQAEQFNDPTITVNDAFKPVVRYWDRITHPEQIISSLPQAVAAMLDPADCGPAFIALPQDIQEIAVDYPAEFFEPVVHAVPRPRPDRDLVRQAVEILKGAKRPLLIAGGGVRYSFAEAEVAAFAERHGIPLVETIAGKSSVSHDHPAHVGPLGIIGSSSANELAAEADVLLSIGTRLQDFATGSWTAFARDAKFVSVNTARWDAVKHRALPVIGDARETVAELDAALAGWAGGPGVDGQRAKGLRALERDARRPAEADQRSRPDLCAGRRRRERQGGRARPRHHGGRRTAGRNHQELAREGAEHLRLRVRLLEHGLRNRGRLGRRHGRPDPHADRAHRRRHLHDDELGHLFERARRPQVHPGGLRQRRLRGHQPPADRQGRGALQQSHPRLPREGALLGRLRQACREHGSPHEEGREPGGSRARARLGQDDRPHDRHHHRLRCVPLESGRRLVGRGRAGGQPPARGARRAAAQEEKRREQRVGV